MESEQDRTKQWDDLGIHPGNDGDVCPDCIGDTALAQFISENATKTACVYCGQTHGSPFAAPLSKVVEHIAKIMNEEFQHFAPEGHYASDGSCFDRFEDILMMPEIGFDPKNPRLVTDVASFFNQRKWWWKDTFSDRRECAWNRFCDKVQHSRRYTFWSSTEDIFPEDHPLYLPASKVLDEISTVVAELGLIKELPIGTKFWRVRDEETSKPLEAPGEFTSPPLEKATKPNRMSPAGIPMFYGTDDFDTAVLEVAATNPKGQQAAGVIFESCRRLHILDLTLDWSQKARHKNYFAPDGRKWRHGVEFLRRFSRDVSRPFTSRNAFLQRLMGDSQPNIDYVPTQVFTEHVRYHMKSQEGQPVDGISYRSSVSPDGCHRCYVLFLEQDDCLISRNGKPQSLRYVEASRKTVPLPRHAGS